MDRGLMPTVKSMVEQGTIGNMRTLTPVLSSYLLPEAKFLESPRDPLLLRALKNADTLVLKFTLRHTTVILTTVVVLVGLSLLPVLYGMGWIYLLGAAAGGGWFVWTSIGLVRSPSAKTAMVNFHASLLQLSLLLVAAILDAWLIQ